MRAPYATTPQRGKLNLNCTVKEHMMGVNLVFPGFLVHSVPSVPGLNKGWLDIWRRIRRDGNSGHLPSSLRKPAKIPYWMLLLCRKFLSFCSKELKFKLRKELGRGQCFEFHKLNLVTEFWCVQTEIVSSILLLLMSCEEIIKAELLAENGFYFDDHHYYWSLMRGKMNRSKVVTSGKVGSNRKFVLMRACRPHELLHASEDLLLF